MSEEQVILVVDDDPHIREVICFALDKAGLATVEASDGEQALVKFREAAPALVLLDILMPEMDGTEVCRQLRAESAVPIIFVSSKDDEVDRIVGLELGGDDYIVKPFSPRELVARVRAVLRRAKAVAEPQPEEEGEVLRHGKLRLDLSRYEAFWDDQEVILTVTEFGIVRVLLGYPGRVSTRDELMERAYRDPNVVTERTIDSHVRRVRRKFAALGGDPLETVHGVGYKLSACE